MNSKEYRTWLRMGVRLFDTNPSVLIPGENRSWMHMDDLEAGAELLGIDWRYHAPHCRVGKQGATHEVSAA